MKAPEFKTRSVYGYNSNNEQHRAPVEVITWLVSEIGEALEVQAELNAKCKAQDYGEFEDEIARHEQDGFVSALKYVRAYLENHIN
jgi:hypothetical protein